MITGLTPEQEKQLIQQLTAYANEGATDDELREFRKAFIEELKKKGTSQPVSTAPQGQPTEPSATSGGLDYTRPKSTEKRLYGEAIGGIVESTSPLQGGPKKEKPKQPPMDVTYRPEGLPSETTQSVVPKSAQEKIRAFDVAEKEIEQGQLPSNPELRTPETVAKVEKKREQLGMNTLEEGAAEAIQNHKDREFDESFADVEDIVDDYIRYSDNNSAKFGTQDYDFGSGKGEWTGLPGLGGKLQESKEGGTDIGRQGKRGEILKTVMDDYFSYLQKANPNQAEAFRNKYSAIKSSTDRNENDEKFLQGIEGHALKLRAAAIKKNVDVYKTAIEQYSQIEKRVNFQGYDKDIKDLKQSAKNLNQEYKNGNISEADYTARWNQIQKGFEDARIKNGLTEDVVSQLEQAKQVYFAYGQDVMKMSSLFGFMDENSKEYRQYNQLQKEIEEAKKAREEAWNTASWYEKPFMAAGEFVRSYSGSIGNMVLDVLQAPKVLHEFVTGDTSYNFLDEYYDGIENFQLEKQKQFGETDSDSVIQYLTSLGGNSIGSITTFALGGSLGGASKLAQFGSTFTTAFLSAEAGAYEEAINTYRMNPRQAATAATAVATATALVEGLIPDIKYFEASPFRKSVMRYIAEGKGLTQAAREALPSSASSYLKTGIKEGGEELAGQLSEDVTKEAINFVGQTEYFKDLWKGKNYRDSFLGGFVGGTTMNVFKRPQGSSPLMEGVMLEAAENADAIISQNTNEKIHSQLKTNLSEAKKDLESLRVHPNWSSLDRTKKGHVFGITQQIKSLESSDVKDPIINAQIEKLKSEREELLSLGSNGIDSKTVGTSSSPQRVMIGGTANEEQNREIEVLNQKKSQFVGPRAAQLMNENRITRKDAQALAEEEWSKTEDGKRREQLVSQTQGEQANFFINEDGDYEIEYNNGKSVVIPKGEGAAEKIRSMGIKSDTGEVSGVTKENTNTLITPKLEKGATIDYNGKNATINSYKEKDGKVVYVNVTTEDGRNLQIREGQPGAGQELLNNLNSLPYDQKDQTRISGQVGVGQESVETKPIETAGQEAAPTSGVVQTQEEVELKPSTELPTKTTQAEVVEENPVPSEKALSSVEETTKALEGRSNAILDKETPILKDKTLKTDGLPDLEIISSKEANQALEAEIGGDVGKIDDKVRFIPIQEYDVVDNKRSAQIAEQIQENEYIEPLIVSYDKNGVYIVEGQHRAGALKKLGYDKAPVIVIYDPSKINRNTAEAYHKAKADGSNPELVKAVEDLIGKPGPQAEGQVKEAENLTSTTKAPAPTTAPKQEQIEFPVPVEKNDENINVLIELKNKFNSLSRKEKMSRGLNLLNKIRGMAKDMGFDVKHTRGYNIKIWDGKKTVNKRGVDRTANKDINKRRENSLKAAFNGELGFRARVLSFFLNGGKVASNQSELGKGTEEYKSAEKRGYIGDDGGDAANIARDLVVDTLGIPEDMVEAYVYDNDLVSEIQDVLSEISDASKVDIQNSILALYEKNLKEEEERGLGEIEMTFGEGPTAIFMSQTSAFEEEEGPKEETKPSFEEGEEFSPGLGPDEEIPFRKIGGPTKRKGATMFGKDAAKKVAEFLKASGIKVIVLSEADYNKRAAQEGFRGTQGVFISKKGEVIYNEKDLNEGYGDILAFHEGIHPVINIIRNTNPALYQKLVEGINKEAKSNKKLQEIVAETEEATQGESKPRKEDELVVETLARIAGGDLELSKLTPSLKEKVIAFMNKIGELLGIGKIKLNSPEIELREFAKKLSDAIMTGSIADVVGKKNLKEYESRFIGTTANGLKITQDSGGVFASESGNDQYSKIKRGKGPDLFTAEKELSVRAVWNENKTIKFNGSVKVNNASDVAHIMRQLENKAVENAFAVHIDKNGKPHIQYLGMGTGDSVLMDGNIILAGAKRYNSKKIYLVHNHPSGRMMPSDPDIAMTASAAKFLKGLNIELEHVILDTYKKEYVHLYEDGTWSKYERDLTKETSEKYLQTLKVEMLDEFEVLTEPVQKIKSSKDAAIVFTQARFTALPKKGMLILNNSNYVVGNFVLPNGFNYDDVVQNMAEVGVKPSIIFYSNQNDYADVKKIKDALELAKVSVLDFIVTNSAGTGVQGYYESYADEGKLIETQEEYGTNSISPDIQPSAIQRGKMIVRGQEVEVKPLPEGTEIVNGFYSTIEKNLRETKAEKQSANKWLTSGLIGKGDEAVYTGVKRWLEAKNPQEQVSKQDILDFMRDNRVQIVEVVLKEGEGKTAKERFGRKIELEGEKSNYKEVLVTLPNKKVGERFNFDKYNQRGVIIYLENLNYNISDYLVDEAGQRLAELSKEQLLDKAKKRYDFESRYDDTDAQKERSKKYYDKAVVEINKLKTSDVVESSKFKSPHFEEPNILVHLRMNTRLGTWEIKAGDRFIDKDGNVSIAKENTTQSGKVLFLEEVQSDFQQEYRKQQSAIDDYVDKNSAKVIEAFKKKGILEVVCP